MRQFRVSFPRSRRFVIGVLRSRKKEAEESFRYATHGLQTRASDSGIVVGIDKLHRPDPPDTDSG